MAKFIRYILTSIILPVYTLLFIRTKTRKPKSNIKTYTKTITKIDSRIQVESIDIEKIDTETSFLKNETLIGITLIGKICNVNTLGIVYFESLNFIETIDNHLKQITIEIIPSLKWIHPSEKNKKNLKLATSKVKYNYLPDVTTFEFYVEKSIVLSGFGNYLIDIQFAQKKETIKLVRYK
jgi:hypothetical protein